MSRTKKHINLEKELRAAELSQNLQSQVDILVRIGGYRKQLEEYDVAIEWYERAVRIGKSNPEPIFNDLAYAYHGLAECHVKKENRRQCLLNLHEFRSAATATGDETVVYRSLFSSTWLFLQLGLISRNHEDFNEALRFSHKSEEYLRNNGKQVGNTTFNEMEWFKLEKIKSSIHAVRGNANLAEICWTAAYSYVVRSGSSDMKYELYHGRIDWPHECGRENAQRLVNMAPPEKMGEALLELSQQSMYSGNVEAAHDILVNVLSNYYKSLDSGDKDILERRLKFFYAFDEHIKTAEAETSTVRSKRRAYEKLGDMFVDYGPADGNLWIAIQYYEKMKSVSVGIEKIPALQSMASIHTTLAQYESALECYEEVKSIVVEVELPTNTLLEAIVDVFIAKCECESVEIRHEEFQELVGRLKEAYILKLKIHQAFSRYLRKLGKTPTESHILEEQHLKVIFDAMDDGTVDDGFDENEYLDPDDEKDEPSLEVVIQKAKERARQSDNEAQILTDKDKVVNNFGETRLHVAARNKDTGKLKQLLVLRYSVNVRDKYGCTPLNDAARAGLTENVQLLLEAGAHPDATLTENVDGEQLTAHCEVTPLMDACMAGEYDMAHLLLVFGASVSQCDSRGCTAAHYLRKRISVLNANDRDGIVKSKLLLKTIEDEQTRLGMVLSQDTLVPVLNVRKTCRPSVGTTTGSQQMFPRQRRSIILSESDNDDVVIDNSVCDSDSMEVNNNHRKRVNTTRSDKRKKRRAGDRKQNEDSTPSPEVPGTSSVSPSTAGLPSSPPAQLQVRLSFVASSGKNVHNLLAPFPRNASIIDVSERCEVELPKLSPAHQQRFVLKLLDGVELDGLLTLDGLQPPIHITCHLQPPTVMSTYCGSKNTGRISSGDFNVLKLLEKIDSEGILDASDAEIDDARIEIFRSVIEAGVRITQLILDGCVIDERDVEYLAVLLTSCHRFSARGSTLTGHVLDAIVKKTERLPLLREVDISQCDIASGMFLAHVLDAVPSIEILRIDCVDITSECDSAIRAVCSCKQLKTLSMSYNKWLLDEHVLNVLKFCDMLVHLELNGASLGTAITTADHTILRHICLSGCMFEESWPQVVSWLASSQVMYIDLSSTILTANGMEPLFNVNRPLTIRAFCCDELNPYTLTKLLDVRGTESRVRLQLQDEVKSRVRAKTAFLLD